MATEAIAAEEQDDYVVEPALRLGARRREEDVEMDITPMIDVTFLLLIFFLVASKMSADQAVALPEARAGIPISATNSVVLVLTKAGADAIKVTDGGNKTFSSDLAVQEEEITQFVKDGIAGVGGTGKGPKQYVLLKAAKGIKHKEVSRVAQAVAGAEIPNLYIAVKHEE